MMPVDDQPSSPVSDRQLAMATGIAAAVAAALLFTVVLPAEYGLDPLGTGAALGLVRDDTPAPPPISAEYAMVPVQAGPMSRFGASYKVDSSEFVLDPYQYVEYKYHLVEGAPLLFSWEASAPVMYDFHGAPDGESESEVSVDERTSAEASGSLVAPFTGMHGWYWENPGGVPITVRLTSSGFYSAAIEYRSNRQRIQHELSAPGPAVAAPER